MGWVPARSLIADICCAAELRQPPRPKACVWCAALRGAWEYWKHVKDNAKLVFQALQGHA